MTTTTNPNSILTKLRQLVPHRPLHYGEAVRLAELQANRLLELHHVNEPGTQDEILTGLPFLEVAVRRDLPVSGSAQWLKPRWLLLLNATEPAVRRRFSLWHEFKHILDHDLDPAVYGHLTNHQIEQIADYFAACSLLPKRLVKRVFGEGQQDPGELAALFGVSEAAMRVRLRQLGLIGPYTRCADGAVRYLRYLSPQRQAA